MNGVILGALIEAITRIITRHMDQHNGVPPDPEQVKAEIESELRAGNAEIADWFRENNLPAPE